jgi:hypothetical protein
MLEPHGKGFLESDATPVECSYCNHAYDLGEHLIGAEKPA